MLDRPDDVTLLALAIETLQERLLPHLKGEDKLTGLLIARALTIAQADGNDDHARLQSIAEIARLLGTGPEQTLSGAKRLLAKAIRDRRFGSDTPEAIRLRDHLLHDTAARLRLVNLKYMAARQRRAESSV
jgi:tellurite resistance protein